MDAIGSLSSAVFRTDQNHRHKSGPQLCKPINHLQGRIPIKPLECAANFYAVVSRAVTHVALPKQGRIWLGGGRRVQHE